MPRKEANAPTERIIRILDDVAALEDYCQTMEEIVANNFSDLSIFPSRPTLESVIAERTRQGIMLSQTRAKREYARRVKGLADDHGVHAVSIKDIEEHLK